jgi:hypothetical protein
MQTEGSLPHSQLPPNRLYPERTQSSPYRHIPLPADQSQYYPPIYTWVSSVFSFPSLVIVRINIIVY